MKSAEGQRGGKGKRGLRDDVASRLGYVSDISAAVFGSFFSLFLSSLSHTLTHINISDVKKSVLEKDGNVRNVQSN